MGKKWTIRLALILTAAFGCWPGRLPAQDTVPPAQDLYVVPAVPYEPVRPKALKPLIPSLPSPAPVPLATPIKQASFQELVEPLPPIPTPPIDLQEPNTRPPLYWVRAEYLNMWVSDAPARVPLITSNTPPRIGAINEPGTKVLFGAGAVNNDANFDALNGGRITVGGWLEDGYEYSWEGTGFSLGTKTFQYTASSPGGNAPTVAIPFNATQPFNLLNPAGETALSNGGAPGQATAVLTTQLWGFEINEVAFIYASKHAYVNAVLGLRYVQLNENLTLTHTSLDAARNGQVTATDGFGTRNQFFGAQLGARAGTAWGHWTFDGSAVVACGPMRQNVFIVGTTRVTNGAFGFNNGLTEGGVFTQPSNIGPSTRGVLAVVPELQFKVGYTVTPWFRPFVAYDVMYLNAVARPGNQIERDVNPTQNAFFVPPGNLVGDAAPTATIRSSGYWAHGLQFGLEFRY